MDSHTPYDTTRCTFYIRTPRRYTDVFVNLILRPVNMNILEGFKVLTEPCMMSYTKGNMIY